MYPLYLGLAFIPLMVVPCTPLDEWTWQLLPQVLAGLSQTPGAALAMSGWGCVGPVSSLIAGVLLVLLGSGIQKLRALRATQSSSSRRA